MLVGVKPRQAVLKREDIEGKWGKRKESVEGGWSLGERELQSDVLFEEDGLVERGGGGEGA